MSDCIVYTDDTQNTGVVLYTDGEVFDQISEMNCTLSWYICLTDDSSKTDTVKEIKEMLKQDNRVYVSVLAEDISSLQNYFHNATVIVMVLTVLLVYSIINAYQNRLFFRQSVVERMKTTD